MKQTGVLVLIGFSVAGLFCGSCVIVPEIITSENQLHTGLTTEQIETILGQPYSQTYSEVSSVSGPITLDTRYYFSPKTSRLYTIVFHGRRARSINWQDISWEVREREKRENETEIKRANAIFGQFFVQHKDYFAKYPTHLDAYKRFLGTQFSEWPLDQLSIEFLNVAFWQFLEKTFGQE